MSRLARLVVLVLLFEACSAAVHATTIVPMSVEDLARSSAAIVIGTVGGLTGVQSSDGAIYTLVDVAVEEVVQGDVSAPVVTLKENGGTVAGRQEVIFGAPSFHRGERVLLFLSVRPDGSLRTTQFSLGKFHIDIDATGMPQAAQQISPGTMVLAPPGTAASTAEIPLGDLLATVRRAGSAAAGSTYRTTPTEASDPSLLREVTAEFKLFNPAGRYFEPDEGTPLSFVIDQNGDAILGLTEARQAVDEAFATWTNVTTASITLQDGGLTGDVARACPGPHKVVFDDPLGEIGPPSNCTGTLAMGGYTSTPDETKVLDGTTFERALCGRLTFANGWGACPMWSHCNVAEVATHELGHAMGLTHSSERNPEPDPALRDATMYFLAHFDGRCAGVRQDDIDGISFVYPTTMPPTITTSNPLPRGTVFVPYHVTLIATGGTGSFTWSLVGQGFPGLDLSPAGVLSGAPMATSSSFFLLVQATDSHGDSHTKRLDITVGNVAPACPFNCGTDSSVGTDDLLTGMQIALGASSLSDCTEFNPDQDDAVTVDEILSAVNAARTGCT